MPTPNASGVLASLVRQVQRCRRAGASALQRTKHSVYRIDGYMGLHP